jgi:hypothetical protein
MLLKQAQVKMLLGDGPDSVGLQVEHVLRVLSQCSHAGVEVRALGWTRPQDAASTWDPPSYESGRA